MASQIANRVDVSDKVQKVCHCESAGLARRQVGFPVQALMPKVRLVVAVHQADAALRESYDEVVEKVEKDTGILVLRGTPEAG